MTYGELVRARKDCRLCVDGGPSRLRNGSSFDFDPDVVSHWSQWLGHQRPRLLVVGQDFSGADYFERNRGRDDPASPTNRSLRDLLAEAGIEAAPPPANDPAAPVYLTNSVLCLKPGGMSGPVRTGWVRNCARSHLAPLLHHLRPQGVVAMGGPAWRAVPEVFPGTACLAGSRTPPGVLGRRRPVAACSRWGTAAGSPWRTARGSSSSPTGGKLAVFWAARASDEWCQRHAELVHRRQVRV